MRVALSQVAVGGGPPRSVGGRVWGVALLKVVVENTATETGVTREGW